MLHLQEYMEILVWNNVNIVINVLKIFHAVFSLSRWKNKKFREKKSNLCECNVKQVGDIWIPPKVQISNAGTQTYDNEEDERIASMDMFGSDLDFWDFEISTIQAQWPKETIDDSGSQDEAVAVEEEFRHNYVLQGEKVSTFSEKGETNSVLAARSEGFMYFVISTIAENGIGKDQILFQGYFVSCFKTSADAVHRTIHVMKRKLQRLPNSLHVAQNAKLLTTGTYDIGTYILSTRCDLPTIKKPEITFVETSDCMIKEFRLNTTDLATLRYGPFNDSAIRSGTVAAFLEFQQQFLVKWRIITVVYLYKNRTICFLQKDYWHGRQTIFENQWTVEVMYVQVQNHVRTATFFNTQGKQCDYCYWHSLTCNELVRHKFTNSGLETEIICCIDSRGCCQTREYREMHIVEEILMMPEKLFSISLIPIKNANAEKLNEKFETKNFEGTLKTLLAPVCKKKNLPSMIHLKKCQGLQYTFGENNLPLNECHIPREAKKSLEYTLKIAIRPPNRRPKQRKDHDLKGRDDEIKGLTKKVTICKNDTSTGYGKSRKEKKREMNTPYARPSLSKPAKMFENHTTETSSIINNYDTPRETDLELPLLYYFFKGGKIKPVIWQTLCCAFMFMMLLPSATGVPAKKYKGIQESARNVSMCPTTKEYIIKRAKIKHCQDFSSSFGEQLEYHCVLNDRGTGFVEVCSPVTKIIGEFCAEYNDGLGGIQPQKQKSCMGTCPFVYNSTASYKYGSVCYKGLRQSKDKDSDTKDPKTSTTYVNNITQDEKDFSLSDINETIHLQENVTIRTESQHFQSSRCEGCSYIAISYIAIAVLVSVLFIILYFKQNSKNSRQASQEVLVSVTSCTVGVHVPIDNNGAAKTMLVETSGCCNGTEDSF